MTREEKEQTGKYILQVARLLKDGCYQQEMLLKAVHIIDEALNQESTTENDLGVKLISKSDVDRIIDCPYFRQEDKLIQIMNLPSITSQEPKTGHWIFVHPLQENDGGAYMCSNCKTGDWSYQNDYDFCPNCGAKMVEPQERSDKE